MHFERCAIVNAKTFVAVAKPVTSVAQLEVTEQTSDFPKSAVRKTDTRMETTVGKCYQILSNTFGSIAQNS